MPEIRWARLSELQVDWFGNRIPDLAAALERKASYLQHYIQGSRSIGDNLADHIERRLDLPVGWQSAESSLDDAKRTRLRMMLDRTKADREKQR